MPSPGIAFPLFHCGVVPVTVVLLRCVLREHFVVALFIRQCRSVEWTSIHRCDVRLCDAGKGGGVTFYYTRLSAGIGTFENV